MHDHVGKEEWLTARRALMVREKELTRLRDEVAAARRALPWEKIGQDYVLGGETGPVSLGDLFAGQSQLIIYHFMLGPGWEKPCKSCSFWAEHYDAIRVHLVHRDTELAAVSSAPYADIARVKARMGWRFPWVSSFGSPFNHDCGASFAAEDIGRKLYNHGTQTAFMGEMPGLSVFAKDETGAIFRTYSAFARGLDALNATYQMLDLTPKGRDEAGFRMPMEWVRLKDEY